MTVDTSADVKPPLSATERLSYVGVYSYPVKGRLPRTLSVFEDGDTLKMKLDRNDPTALLYHGDNTFTLADAPAVVISFHLQRGEAAGYSLIVPDGHPTTGKRYQNKPLRVDTETNGNNHAATTAERGTQRAKSNRHLLSLSGAKIDEADLDNFLRQQLDSLDLPGLAVAVINERRIVYHGTLGIKNMHAETPVDERTLFEAASLSKPVFAYLTMRMVDQGVLDLDTPLYQYLPFTDLDHDDRYKRITARMVLSHTTGLPNWRTDTGASKVELAFLPGTRFQYSGEGFEYLADVLAHLNRTERTGLEKVFQKEVAVPLGMEHATFTNNAYLAQHKATGHQDGVTSGDLSWPWSRPFGAAFSLHTEAVAYARFLVALLKGEGLRTETSQEMLRAQVSVPDDTGTRGLGYGGEGMGKMSFGLGVGIELTPLSTHYLHSGNNGNFQSNFLIEKTTGNGYVFFTNCDRGHELNQRLRAFLTKMPGCQDD